MPQTGKAQLGKISCLPEEYDYQLSEENICVLDMVRVTLEDGRGLPCREVLKADRELRDILGIPWRGGEMLQPGMRRRKTGYLRSRCL
ncbi:MAG: hypothetical protein ACLUOI_12205 [Eisenbergiella sp.]